MTPTYIPSHAETNEGRADAGQRALDAFADQTSTHEEEALGDLLANLRHLCDRNRIDWQELLVYVDRTHSDEIAAELAQAPNGAFA